jgi:hypothetical protein
MGSGDREATKRDKPRSPGLTLSVTAIRRAASEKPEVGPHHDPPSGVGFCSAVA